MNEIISKTDNRRIFKTIVTLSLPTVVEQGLQTIVSYIDTAMVGQISADASAAVGLTLTVGWLVNAPLFAMGVGFLSYIARQMGAGHYENIKKAGNQAVIMTLFIGALLGIITGVVSPFLPVWLGAEPNIRKITSWYFFITTFPMIFRASSIILASVLRAVYDTKTPMKINLLMNIINIVFNFILIRYIGIYGAAISTALSYIVGGILMYIVFCKNPYISSTSSRVSYDRHVMNECIKTGLPIALERSASCLGHVVFTGLVSNLGTISIAAHSIALTAEEAFYIPGYGMQTAASTLAGNAYGENNKKKLIKTSAITAAIAITIISTLSIFLYLFPDYMMSLFSNDARVIEKGSEVLKLVAMSEPAFALFIILEGVANGIGDTKFTFIDSTLSMWGIRIVSTFICINILGLGLKTVWMCMIADNLFKCITFFTRFIYIITKKLK